MRLLFDIETNGLLSHQTKPGEKSGDKVHCIVIKDIDTGKKWTGNNRGRSEHIETITECLHLLETADELFGQNIIAFDLPFLQMCYPDFKPKAKLFDTLVASRLIFTNLKDLDMRKRIVTGRLVGSHSLKAWGQRLKCLKGDYGETTDWAQWTQEMQDYCEQDVEVNDVLLQMILAKKYSQRAIDLEMRFAEIMSLQEQRGFAFNVEAAKELYATLQNRRESLRDQLQVAFPATIETMKTPAYWSDPFTGNQYSKKSEAPGTAVKNRLIQGPMRTKEIPFNPGSRLMIGQRLCALGWSPTEFTEDGQATIDDEILQTLPYPEAKLLAEYLMVEKRIGQIAEGDQAWLRLERNGRIHGKVNTGGAVTGRCTHSNPNMAQVPKATPKVPYGEACRALFTTTPGFILVGCDAEGLELRGLAHFMAYYDGGAYGETVVNGKKELGTAVHQVNQKAAGLDSYDSAKTFIYAFIYGAGDPKLGLIVGLTEEEANVLRTQYPSLWNQAISRAQRQGRKPDPMEIARAVKGGSLRAKFLKGLPALGSLIAAVKERAKASGKWLKGLDGRLLHVRSMHACLNTVIQSAGAIIMKQALILMYDACIAKGWEWEKDFAFVANIHDEFQSEVRPDIAEEFRQMAERSITLAGESFGFRCRLDGSASIGMNWKETH